MQIKNINPSKTTVSIDCAKTSIPFGETIDIADIFYLRPEIQVGLAKGIIKLIGEVNIPEEDVEDISQSSTVRYAVKWASGVLSLEHSEGDSRFNYKISAGDEFLNVPRKHTKNASFEGAVKAGILTEIVEKPAKKKASSKSAKKAEPKVETKVEAKKGTKSRAKKAEPKITRKMKTSKKESVEPDIHLEELVGNDTLRIVIHDENIKTVKPKKVSARRRKTEDEDSMFIDVTPKFDPKSKINQHEEVLDIDKSPGLLLEEI